MPVRHFGPAPAACCLRALSYTNHYGYVWNMNRKIASGPAQLRPEPAALRLALLEAALLVAGKLTAGQRNRFLQALLQGGGLDAACAAAGVERAQVISERLADPGFHRDWRSADAGRLEALETLLIDQLAIAMGREQPLADKATLQLWQALREERRRAPLGMVGEGVPAEPASRRPGQSLPDTAGRGAADRHPPASDPPVSDAPVSDALETERRIAALIAEVEGRMRVAEAGLGLPPAPAGATRR